MKDQIIEKLFRPAVWVAAKVYYRVEFSGLEQVPLSGRLLITPNHVSYPDPPLVALPVMRRVHFMAWDRLFDVPGMGHLIRFLAAFPVKLGGFDRSALRIARELLEEEEAVLIFPEGGRSPSGKLMEFKPGFARLALETGTPVVPVSINGAFESWPVGRLLPFPGRVRITFHAPIPAERVDEHLHPAEFKERVRLLTNQVRAAVASGLDPKYLNEDWSLAAGTGKS